MRRSALPLLLLILTSVVSAFAVADPPVATNPAMNARREATLDLEWETVAGASSYDVKLTPKSGGASIEVNVKENKLSHRMPVGVYLLRIRSQDEASGLFGPWSEPTEIEVAAREIELSEPVNGAEIDADSARLSRVVFRWRPARGAKIYVLKIWMADDETKQKEFKTGNTALAVRLPTAKSYRWQVTFESDTEVGYLTASTSYGFSLVGPRLTKPVVQAVADPKKGLSALTQIRWTRVPRATFYTARMWRRFLDENEWEAVAENEAFAALFWRFDRLKPGQYRFEVIAQAKNRRASEPGVLELTVKPTADELRMALEGAVRP